MQLNKGYKKIKINKFELLMNPANLFQNFVELTSVRGELKWRNLEKVFLLSPYDASTLKYLIKEQPRLLISRLLRPYSYFFSLLNNFNNVLRIEASFILFCSFIRYLRVAELLLFLVIYAAICREAEL